MRAVQVMLDEALLARLADDEEVRRDGRSAFLRRAAVQYLESKRRRGIAEAYGRAYGSGNLDDLRGWEDEGEWPSD